MRDETVPISSPNPSPDSCGESRPTKSCDFRESYAGDRFVRSMAYVRAYPRSLPPLRALLHTIETPVQIIYGLHDPIVPPSHAELLHRSIPRSQLLALDCGHITWEDNALEYGAAVCSWIDGGFLKL